MIRADYVGGTNDVDRDGLSDAFTLGLRRFVDAGRAAAIPLQSINGSNLGWSKAGFPVIMNVREIEAHEFAMVKRGYDPDEVRSYLRKVAISVKDTPGRAYGDVGERVASVFESADKAACRRLRGRPARAGRRGASRSRGARSGEVGRSRRHHNLVRNEADQYAATTRAEADRVCAELKDTAEREALQTRMRATEFESLVTAENQRARAEVDEYVSYQTAAADRMRAEVEERIATIEKKAHEDLADAHASASAVRKQADADAKRIIADAKDAGERIVDDARDDSEQVVNDAQREAVEIVLAAERKAAVRTDTVLRNAQQRLEIMVSAEREVFDRMARAFDALHGVPDIDGLAAQPALPETTSNGGYSQNYLDR